MVNNSNKIIHFVIVFLRLSLPLVVSLMSVNVIIMLCCFEKTLRVLSKSITLTASHGLIAGATGR